MNKEILNKLNSGLKEFTAEVQTEDCKEFEKSLKELGYYPQVRFFERKYTYYKIVKKNAKLS